MSSEPLTLISATPSPFARMNRIALTLKHIPFTLQNEVPWESATKTPSHNPLEKLPILLFPESDGRPPVYDSAHIQEYIVQKYADSPPKLLTGNIDLDLHARQIQVLAEGLMDAFVLGFWEARRGEGMRSGEWMARQDRKIDGAMGAFDGMVRERRGVGKKFLVGEELTIADIAAVCAVGQIDFSGVREGWREKYPGLCEWWEEIDGGEGFRDTRPVMFDLKEKIV
ncbi:glutathione S-transferase domain-containing protein [Lophiostoma macrostomum CBS 122681]|uniref:Glutathione S-transferase domain-containing protein n=1 Tax=Lophiostoma macrostomum CBS 122681 TaxID=1314788 RepID=A0A6A6T460_9PLEO|nr:glutathione S-transferase domain-containing protein [Lophiostoma macrostomum CBS 122681]